MRVYIVTDLEGVTGVTLWSQVTPATDPAAYDRSRRLLMHELNAAVEGCLEAGATRVTILDGHGWPCNVVPELMHPAAEYLCGSGLPRGWGLEAGYDCALQIGCHAMNRTPDGVLYHTQSHLSDARYWYNDREFGEIGQCGLVFGHFDVPVVMVTGDFAACREATDFFGPACVTVPVKYGYGRYCCRMLAPEKTAELIRAGAREALGRVGQVAPLKLDLPLRARVETLVENATDATPADQVAAAPHRTHEGTCATQLDIYSF